ncbi:hypothetical protein Nm8I071_37360 [Nonomuraea sp. TT08I-71]|nr:hypothetical protein Nm8I071_37360 [Nonomuraea sp. TT08I-71]
MAGSNSSKDVLPVASWRPWELMVGQRPAIPRFAARGREMGEPCPKPNIAPTAIRETPVPSLT